MSDPRCFGNTIGHSGDNEFHLAFSTPDYEAAHRLHKEMGCICYENPQMRIYFIEDPDGYWLEIVPERR
jgi:lactoylglutathione lyase